MHRLALTAVLAAAVAGPPAPAEAGRCVDQVDRLASGLDLAFGAPRPDGARTAPETRAPAWIRIIRSMKGPGARGDAQAAGSSLEPKVGRMDVRRRLMVSSMLSEARAADEDGHSLACYAQLNATRNALAATHGAGAAR